MNVMHLKPHNPPMRKVDIVRDVLIVLAVLLGFAIGVYGDNHQQHTRCVVRHM